MPSSFSSSRTKVIRSSQQPKVNALVNIATPIGFGFLVSIGWLVACMVITSNLKGGIAALSTMNAAETAIALTAIALPLTLVWNWISSNLQNQFLRASIVGELNRRVQPEPVSNTIGTDTQKHISAISGELETRIQNFHVMTDKLSSILVGMTAEMESHNQSLTQMTNTLASRSSDISAHLSQQTIQIDAAEERLGTMLENIATAQADIVALSDELCEDVERPINNAATQLRHTVVDLENEIERLEERLDNATVTQKHVITASEEARSRLANEADQLSLASGSTLANIDSLSAKLGDQISKLDQIGLSAAQNLAGVSERFTQKAHELSNVTSQLGDQFTTIATSIEAQNNDLAHMSEAASSHAENIANQLQQNATILTSETDLALSRIRKEMDQQLQSWNAHVDEKASYVEGTARRLEHSMLESMKQGNDLLETLRAVNAETASGLDTALETSLEQYKNHIGKTLESLHAQAQELSRNEVLQLERIKENIESTLTSLQKHCQVTVGEMAETAKESASLLNTQAETLETRLISIDTTSSAMHERLTQVVNALSQDLIESINRQIREHADTANSQTHVLNQALDSALVTWRTQLDQAIEQAKDNAQTLVTTTADNMKHLSDDSVSAILCAAERVPEITHAMTNAANHARREMIDIASDMDTALTHVVETIGTTSQTTQLMQRDLEQVPTRLDAATKVLDGMSTSIANHAQYMEIHANAIEASSDKISVRLEKHVHAMQEATTISNQMMEEHHKQLGDRARQVVEDTQHLPQEIAAGNDKSTDLHNQKAFARQASNLQTLLMSIGGLTNEQGHTLQAVGQETITRTSRLMSLVNNDDRDTFLESAEQLVYRLHVLAVDVDSMLTGTLDPQIIHAFQNGDRGAAVRKLVVQGRDNKAIGQVAQLYLLDQKFKEHVDLYVQEFDDLLGKAVKADKTKLLHRTFLTAHIGKLYVFLSQSLGVLAAAE